MKLEEEMRLQAEKESSEVAQIRVAITKRKLLGDEGEEQDQDEDLEDVEDVFIQRAMKTESTNTSS